jgi:UDP-N-acetylmuramoylalanine--D-glutamate ligase
MNTEHTSSLQDQAVLVLGLGQSGLAMARWCSHLGARVWVMDTRSEPPGLADLRNHVPQAQFIPVANPIYSRRVQKPGPVTG